MPDWSLALLMVLATAVAIASFFLRFGQNDSEEEEEEEMTLEEEMEEIQELENTLKNHYDRVTGEMKKILISTNETDWLEYSVIYEDEDEEEVFEFFYPEAVKEAMRVHRKFFRSSIFS